MPLVRFYTAVLLLAVSRHVPEGSVPTEPSKKGGEQQHRLPNALLGGRVDLGAGEGSLGLFRVHRGCLTPAQPGCMQQGCNVEESHRVSCRAPGGRAGWDNLQEEREWLYKPVCHHCRLLQRAAVLQGTL